MENYQARWCSPPDSRGKIRCTLCPRECRLAPGQPGYCYIRQNINGQMVNLGYGRPLGIGVDPVEKKPLNHYYPATDILSFGTAGCNLGCKFCQNWTSSKARTVDLSSRQVTPEEVVQVAIDNGCPSIAFTYNEPIIFAEYAIDVAAVAQRRGVRCVAVTAGYISAQAREEFFANISAANVDLKSMSENFYHKLSAAHLQPVLETLDYLAQETDVWVEITNLVIPGHNDSNRDFEQLSSWIVEHMGAHTPIHFSAFHPDYKLTSSPRTPAATLGRAREVAQKNGALFVYTGNVTDERGQSTYCPGCGQVVITRQWYRIASYMLDAAGACKYCGHQIEGRFGSDCGQST